MDTSTQAAEGALGDVANMLREQLWGSNDFIRRVFELDRAGNGSETELKLATRLIQANAGLAMALKRLEGTRQDIVVTHAPAKP